MRLFGECEGVKRHGSGFVADGVEAELEAELRAFDGHFVELVLRVLGKAGVAGIVGVGSFHSSGARAERTIHEAFEEAGVKHGVVHVVVIAHSDQLGQRSLEGQPFGDAEVELAFLLQLLVDEKILPVAEVLHAGDAVGEGVGDGEFVAACGDRHGWEAG